MQETLAKCRVVAGRRNEDRDCVLAWPCVFCCRNASTLRVAGHAMDHSFACRLAHDPCSIAVPDTAASCCHNCTQRSLAQVVASQSQARAPKAPSGVVEVSDGPNNNKKSTRKTRLKAKSASPPAQPPAPASSPPAEAPVQTPAQVPASVVADPASSPALEGPPQTPSQTMPSQAPASAVADPASSPSLEGPPQTPAQAPAQTPSQAPASVVGPAAERAPEASPEMQHTASMLGQALFVQPHGGKEAGLSGVEREGGQGPEQGEGEVPGREVEDEREVGFGGKGVEVESRAPHQHSAQDEGWTAPVATVGEDLATRHGATDTTDTDRREGGEGERVGAEEGVKGRAGGGSAGEGVEQHVGAEGAVKEGEGRKDADATAEGRVGPGHLYPGEVWVGRSEPESAGDVPGDFETAGERGVGDRIVIQAAVDAGLSRGEAEALLLGPEGVEERERDGEDDGSKEGDEEGHASGGVGDGGESDVSLEGEGGVKLEGGVGASAAGGGGSAGGGGGDERGGESEAAVGEAEDGEKGEGGGGDEAEEEREATMDAKRRVTKGLSRLAGIGAVSLLSAALLSTADPIQLLLDTLSRVPGIPPSAHARETATAPLESPPPSAPADPFTRPPPKSPVQPPTPRLPGRDGGKDRTPPDPEPSPPKLRPAGDGGGGGGDDGGGDMAPVVTPVPASGGVPVTASDAATGAAMDAFLLTASDGATVTASDAASADSITLPPMPAPLPLPTKPAMAPALPVHTGAEEISEHLASVWRAYPPAEAGPGLGGTWQGGGGARDAAHVPGPGAPGRRVEREPRAQRRARTLRSPLCAVGSRPVALAEPWGDGHSGGVCPKPRCFSRGPEPLRAGPGRPEITEQVWQLLEEVPFGDGGVRGDVLH